MIKIIIACLMLVFGSFSAHANLKSITSTGGSKYSAVVNGEVISTHTKQEKAEESVIKSLESNCTQPTCTGYVRQAVELVIVVIGVEGSRIVLTWDIPTTREDGTELLLSDIQRYEIEMNGDLAYEAGNNQTSLTTDPLSQGIYMFRIRTVAEEAGEYSELINVAIQ